MALADIVERIERDAISEAQAIETEAQQRADALVERAREEAELARTRTVDTAQRDSKAEAATLLATARLEARDRLLSARGDLIKRTLAGARDAVLALGDDAYAEALARRIVATAKGGEKVLIAGADVSRLADRLPASVVRAGGGSLGLVWASEAAPIEHGVVLRGDRVSIDLSADATLEERHDELAMVVANVLFAEEGA